MTKNLIDTKDKKQKAVLAMAVIDKDDNPAEDLYELKALVEAAGAEYVGEMYQNRTQVDPKYLLGKGKVEELKRMVEELDADLVVFDNQLSGSRLNNLEEYLGVRVLDRAMLILDIFAQRALSQEGKTQVELAQLKYTLPRLSGISGTSGRFGGGIGMRGPGETALELSKRIVEKKIVEKERALQKLKQERDLRQSNRNKSNKKVVALVGYTNSGKSTLLNTITKANVLAKDMLFATLDTTTRSLWLGEGKEILLTDTVGFVNKLPHELVEAFSSTLEEAVMADIIVHVVDASNDKREVQQKVVLKVLKELGIKDTPIITVFNKCDKAVGTFVDGDLLISAKNNINIDKLKNKIIELL